MRSFRSSITKVQVSQVAKISEDVKEEEERKTQEVERKSHTRVGVYQPFL